LAELSFSIRVARSLAAAMKRKRCQVTALQSTRLDVIRLIRAIRGLNILLFQLQNHSTSLMPIRVIEATKRIARKKAECARRSVSFMSAYDNPFTGSVQIRENPCSPFHPCSISTKQLDDTVHSHKSLIFPLRRCASARDHFSIRNHQRPPTSSRVT